MSDWEAFGWKDGVSLTTTMAASEDWKFYQHIPYTTYFDGANLTNAVFDKVYLNGVHFEGATLNGTSFRGANIGRAVFTDARDLEKAHFDGAYYNEPFKPQGLTEDFMKDARIAANPPQADHQ